MLQLEGFVTSDFNALPPAQTIVEPECSVTYRISMDNSSESKDLKQRRFALWALYDQEHEERRLQGRLLNDGLVYRCGFGCISHCLYYTSNYVSAFKRTPLLPATKSMRTMSTLCVTHRLNAILMRGITY